MFKSWYNDFMMDFYGMGWGGMGFLGFLSWLVWTTTGALAAVWLWRHLQKRN